jgi:hypothetical protein
MSFDNELDETYKSLHEGFLGCVRDLNIIYKNLDTKSEYSMVFIREPIHILRMTRQPRNNGVIKVLLDTLNSKVDETIMTQIELSFPYDVIRQKTRNGYMYCFTDY